MFIIKKVILIDRGYYVDNFDYWVNCLVKLYMKMGVGINNFKRFFLFLYKMLLIMMDKRVLGLGL